MSGGDGNEAAWRPSDGYPDASGSGQWQSARPSFSYYSPGGYVDGNRRGSTNRYNNNKRFNKSRKDDYRRESNRYYDRSKSRGGHHRRRSSSSDEDRSRLHSRHRRRRSSSASSQNSEVKKRSKDANSKKSHYSDKKKKDNSKPHSKRYSKSRSKSPASSKYNKYSDDSQNESDDIDGIALDEVPPSSWNNESNVITFSSNYSEYRQELPVATTSFKNDGSFLEMFKKMQETQKKEQETEQKPEVKKPAVALIGKRRGGRVLKTGVVKKIKSIDEQVVEDPPKDAWSIYMSEVKKYREAKCDEEVKTRPLVK